MDSIEYDVLVVGSGAGALTAAITAHDNGGNVLVVEKSDMYGGTSATSGGGIWIPCNHLMEEHGETDTPEAALEYLKACVGDKVSDSRLVSYVKNAPKMLKDLEDTSDVKFVSTPYADYLTEKPGSKDGWRTLDPLPMSATKLGKEFLNMRPPHPQTIFGGFTITVNEAKKIITRSKGWKWIMAKLMISYRLDIPMRMKSKRHRRLCLGNALVGRCLTSVFKREIPIWRSTSLKSLVEKNGKVTGAIVTKNGEDILIMTKRGVILAAGGFEHNSDMRKANLPGPTDTSWSATPGQNTGDAHVAAEAVGANLTLMDAAWWGPSVRLPRDDRSRILFAERALPGIYIVNENGKRYLNEAASYDEVGRQLQAHPKTSWVIFDRRAREKYGIGPLYPTAVHPDSKWNSSIKAIVKKSDTIEGLASLMGVDETGLMDTVEKVAKYSKTGVDEDFGSGSTSYDKYYGDPSVSPNPCLAPLSKAPFYAFPVYPGDIGTKGGVDVDINAQALNKKGRPILGLYATGNTASSVMGYTYPGAGSTIGPAMTFGYVAAKHAMGANS
ncbi:MAG: FAD-binding protein [Hellea sp.]|nr:FAD-binding protein [Hellea sp.]MDG1522679.1 FAD-binding protein [Hellea sp.]MDG1666096.1 FAD-binding protein [Hellea sp.]MDG2361746.1 FAD-binding protein [Hellea sp.]|tara:strand:+ start:6280 stop:7944 length:1665 start_codon:yes stop_codon:yes gene_type:complete